MLSVSEALDLIERTVNPLLEFRVPLGEALGLVLADGAVADLDSPPFDKALMDGYAVQSTDLARLPVELTVIEEALAGVVPWKVVGPGEATRIMTGAPIPRGADVVVPVEQTRLVAGSSCRVEIQPPSLVPGKHILRRGESTKAGTTVIPAGRLLRCTEIGCLAELGRQTVRVIRRPRIAVLPTGDELVPVGEKPGPGQIRNSNEAMLVAQLRQAGYDAFPLGIARDNRHDLRTQIDRGLEYDVLVISGGVSAGKVDLVPVVLAEAGVTQVFHKVRLKPGQPLWFGGIDRAQPESTAPTNFGKMGKYCYVFGLPGNPVSSLVCCELFVKTALRRLGGLSEARPKPIFARLATAYRNVGNRPTYHPARLEWTSDGAQVTPVRWIGSADLSATVEANAMIAFEETDREYTPGELVAVHQW